MPVDYFPARGAKIRHSWPNSRDCNQYTWETWVEVWDRFARKPSLVFRDLTLELSTFVVFSTLARAGPSSRAPQPAVREIFFGGKIDVKQLIASIVASMKSHSESSLQMVE
jgi:hypothetical protein